MKALTLHQPWASLLAAGHKTIETRSWSTPYRGPIAIHASAKVRRISRRDPEAEPTRADELAHELTTRDALFPVLCCCGHDAKTCMQRGLSSLPHGAVLAVAMLVDVLPIIHPRSAVDYRRTPHVMYADDGRVRVWRRRMGHVGFNPVPAECYYAKTLPEHEAALGDYSAGRFAWLLADVTELRSPVYVRGAQRLWDWTPPKRLAGLAS